MDKQSTMRRTFKFLVVISIFTIGGAYFFERSFVDNGIRVAGEIKSFRDKQFSSAQGDSIEMEISFVVAGKQSVFYGSRNIIEQLMGTYKVGDAIPVVYNPGRHSDAKIGYLQHLYEITLTYLILFGIFFSVLIYVWFKNEKTHKQG